MLPSRILLQVSGSIAAFKAASLASQLVKLGVEVQVVATPSALKFVGEATFEGLTSRPVLSDTFTQGRMMDHIHLARWAEAFVLYPATANTLNRMAQGLADDLLGALALAKAPEVPFFIAPAMNHQMWFHPATQSSVQTLKSWGHSLLSPQSGQLACGEVGEGRVIEPEAMIQALQTHFTPPQASRGKVLITSGGTREAIDGVRYITNMSSGRTGATIADKFLKAGFQVSYLAAQEAVVPQASSAALKVYRFTDFNSLNHNLETLLNKENYLGVIHAAAVSDYSVEEIVGAGSNLSKIDSTQDLTLRLKKNFKIISRIKSYSLNKNITLVGFKLTAGDGKDDVKQRIEKMVLESAPDYIVHNDLSEVGAQSHKGQIYQGLTPRWSFSDKSELANLLVTLFNNFQPEQSSQLRSQPEVTL